MTRPATPYDVRHAPGPARETYACSVPGCAAVQGAFGLYGRRFCREHRPAAWDAPDPALAAEAKARAAALADARRRELAAPYGREREMGRGGRLL